MIKNVQLGLSRPEISKASQ